MDQLESIIERVQAGDVDAYGEVVHRFQDMAVGYAYSLTGDFHLAEDAVQLHQRLHATGSRRVSGDPAHDG